METDKQQSLQHGYVLQGKQNRYVIDRVLGQGAFGITYLARYKASITGDMGSGAAWVQVAIKEFFMRDLNVRDGSTGYLNDSSQDSLIGRYRRAFMREARNLAGLHHPNIVNVFEVIETNNTVYIVMEYINGGSLDDHILRHGHLSERESTERMLKLCSAVSCMHEHRMLHLDIKPKNVMLDEDGQLYLIDFGLSKQYTADGEPESSTSIGLGTPGYAPSEQAVHQDGDKKFRATLDIYALGATLFKMLTGKTPPNATDVSDSVLDGDNIIPKRLKDVGVTDKLAAVVAKAMFPSSSKRYQTVSEFESALLDIQDSTSNGETTVVIPEPISNPIPDSIANNHTPNPKPKQPKPAPERNTGTTKSFPKWLYAVISVIVVGLIVFLAIPKSKAPQSVQPPVSVTDTTETMSSSPVPAPTPEPKPVSESKPEPKTVALTSISLSKTSLTLEEGATSTLTVRYTPSDATDKSTTWKSTDTKVATVSSNGKVTALKAGSAAIMATAGGRESYCNVTVTAKAQPVQQQSASSTSSSPATGTSNGHEWIDLGLSVKWSTCNVGASSPSAYGDYYAWGETSTKSSYTWENYRSRTSGDSYDNVKFNKYNTQSTRGTVDNRTVLEMSDDVARQKWGGSWRMPTEKEFQELIDNCTWTWTTMNGVNGYKVTSKKSGYTGRSIFLPAAGYRDDTSLYLAGEVGYYWSSSLDTGLPYFAQYLFFNSGYHFTYYYYRLFGLSVRPVCP